MKIKKIHQKVLRGIFDQIFFFFKLMNDVHQDNRHLSVQREIKPSK